VIPTIIPTIRRRHVILQTLPQVLFCEHCAKCLEHESKILWKLKDGGGEREEGRGALQAAASG
jgi:hypothetical protein